MTQLVHNKFSSVIYGYLHRISIKNTHKTLNLPRVHYSLNINADSVNTLH
jgi:hypothetical protein